MRVITGSARGRRLKELEGMETRPTTDRVKEGIFSVIQFDVPGSRVLDLFAGTGQLGIEALSRGAASAVFVEHRADAVRLVRDNLHVTGLSDRAQVKQGDALAFLDGTREKFDLIFLDPPYAADLLPPVLERLCRFDILSPHGIIVAEHPLELTLPPLMPPYRVRKTYRYGRIAMTICRRDADQENEENNDENSNLLRQL